MKALTEVHRENGARPMMGAEQELTPGAVGAQWPSCLPVSVLGCGEGRGLRVPRVREHHLASSQG
jgi:hypothetical protein